MPRVRVSTGIELYYEEHGSGPPLLLIPGYGYWHWCWFKNIPDLSRHFRVIALDNRGTGGSDKPIEPYTIPQMALEAADVLAALGITRAHVLGTSMGGFIAQELALTNPNRVHGLVLVGTSAGGPAHVPPDPAVLAALAPDPSLTPEQNIRRALPYAAAPGYWDRHPEEREAIIARRLAMPTPVHAAQAQLEAVRAWPGTADRLHRIAAPTLVIHGDADQVVPPVNGERLAAGIPGARLHVLPGAGHVCFIDSAAAFNRIVTEFLRSLS